MNSEFFRATRFFTVFTFAFGLLIPILPTLFESFGFNDAQLGWIYAILPLMMFIIAPLAGNLSDKLGRKYILRTAILLDIVAITIFIFTQNGLVAVFARVFDAIAIATVLTVSIARVQDSVTDEHRGEKSGQAFSFESIAKISAPLVGGLIADVLFMRAPFILALILLLFLFKLPKKENSNSFTVKDFEWLPQVKKFLGFRKLKGMAILGIVHHAVKPALEFFLPLLIIREFSLSYTFVGIALFIHQLPNILQFIFGKYSDKNPSDYVLLGSVIVALGTLFVFFANTYWLLIIVLFIRGLGSSIWNVSAWNLMAGIGKKHNIQGKTIGSYLAVSKTGDFISAVVGGTIVMLLGIQTLFAILGIIMLLGVFTAFFLIRD